MVERACHEDQLAEGGPEVPNEDDVGRRRRLAPRQGASPPLLRDAQLAVGEVDLVADPGHLRPAPEFMAGQREAQHLQEEQGSKDGAIKVCTHGLQQAVVDVQEEVQPPHLCRNLIA